MTYWYLGSPYTKYPGGLEEAFQVACENTGLLMRAGVPVFCPIAHSHSAAVYGKLPKLDHEFWMRVGKPMVDAAHGLIVLRMAGWAVSSGLSQEIEWFEAANKPILFMQPGLVPFERPVSLLGPYPPAEQSSPPDLSAGSPRSLLLQH